MKIIKPSVEFFGSVPTDYDSAIRFIEMAGRTCYKSEDKITPDSAEKFVRKLIKAGHLAMVEHSNFVVKTTFARLYPNIKNVTGKYLTVKEVNGNLYVGGNLTAWEQAWSYHDSVFKPFVQAYGDLFGFGKEAMREYTDDWSICSHDKTPKELHRYSAKFICDRGVSHELVRHRPCSFAQESTRYVNYAGKEMKFIEPTNFENWDLNTKHIFRNSCLLQEKYYKDMITLSSSPQQARAVLPNALKTELVVTADAAEWNHIRKLRTSPASHPDMQRVMSMMPWETFL